MALTNIKFNLDINPGSPPTIINVSEYDINRQFIISLTENGKPFQIPSNVAATIEGTLNQRGFQTAGEISNNTIIFLLTKAMTASRGRAWTKVKLVQDNKPISTCGFWLNVDRAGVEADTVIGAPGFEEQIREAAEDWLEDQGFQSPTVSITDIEGGHRVTFTDAEHPQGQSIDVLNGADGEDGGGFELPEGGEAGQALISDGEGGAEWGNVSAGEEELDVYGFTDDDYTAMDITDQCLGTWASDWTGGNTSNGNTLLTPVIPTPQKILIVNNSPTIRFGGGKTRFLNGKNPETATVLAPPGEINGRWNPTVPSNSSKLIYTQEFGRTGYEYMQMKMNTSGGYFNQLGGKFQIIAYYTDRRPEYAADELLTDDGFEHDVQVRWRAGVLGSPALTTAILFAVVPFYPGRTYKIKGGYWVNIASTNIDSLQLFDDSIIDNYYTVLMPGSDNSGLIQPPMLRTFCTVIQSGATNNGLGILEYVCRDPSETGIYPKWVAFAMYSTTKPQVSHQSTPYPYDNEVIAAWMEAAMTRLDSYAPWGYVTAFDDFIDRKASDTDFVNPNVWKKNDAGSMYKAFSVNDGSPMKGATLTVFGDSISDNFGGHNLVSNGFISKICREFGMKIDNRAKSGSNMYVATDSYASVCGINMLNAYLDELEAETIEQSGYILIEFGANAYDSQIGTNADTSANTNRQYGAVKYFIEKLREKSPLSVFGFILPHDVDWSNTSTAKQAGVPLARAAIKEVCEAYRVPYLDMYNDSGLTVSMLSDGVHIGTPQSANLYYHAVRRFVMGL